jgi:hypothetical protein
MGSKCKMARALWLKISQNVITLQLRGKGPKSANRLFDPKSANTRAVGDVYSAFDFVDFLTQPVLWSLRKFP